MLSSMCQQVARLQFDSCAEKQPFWNHDGLNLTYSDQCHGVLWLTPKNCYKVYSLNLIDEFTSLFSPKVIVAGLPRESLSCLCGNQCFSVLMNERRRKLKANMRQNVPFRANMGQHCSLSAVQRQTAFLEQSWWPEFDMFGSMPWCWLPWHKLLPRLRPKNCCKVYSLNLTDEFTSLFSPKVIVACLPL